MTRRFRSLLITGASAGLGAALARAYAGPDVHLALIGRDGDRLTAVAEACRALGTTVSQACIDVTDTHSLREWITAHDRLHPLDLVIANAGVANTLAGTDDTESWADIRRVFDTNVYGALATLQPAIAGMRARGSGQLAIVSSLGAYAGMPISPAYNASKAALKVYGEGLRGCLAPHGIGVSVILPGFVKSAMSDTYPGPRPFLVPTAKAADIIKQGLSHNRASIAFPVPLHAVMWFLSLLPTPASLFLQRVFRFE